MSNGYRDIVSRKITEQYAAAIAGDLLIAHRKLYYHTVTCYPLLALRHRKGFKLHPE